MNQKENGVTPEERAAKITEGLNGLRLAFTYTGPASLAPPFDSLSVGKDGVYLFREAIAKAIREEAADLRARVAFLEGELATAKALTEPMRDQIIAHCDKLAEKVFASRPA